MTDDTSLKINYQSNSFKKMLKHRIEHLRPGSLPLDKGTTQGGIVDDNNISASILAISEAEHSVNIKAGVFFTEIVGGCSCGDDPITINAYCDIIITMNKLSDELQFSIIDE
ncbi:MAG: glucosamine--fructose-6-phosphate aminotransferase [Gammaproteobacteria bacterium]|nr:glucosamine--fructose-6-phosphate aminotransferase [Gammaproteobacteria bacterium]